MGAHAARKPDERPIASDERCDCGVRAAQVAKRTKGDVSDVTDEASTTYQAYILIRYTTEQLHARLGPPALPSRRSHLLHAMNAHARAMTTPGPPSRGRHRLAPHSARTPSPQPSQSTVPQRFNEAPSEKRTAPARAQLFPRGSIACLVTVNVPCPDPPSPPQSSAASRGSGISRLECGARGRLLRLTFSGSRTGWPPWDRALGFLHALSPSRPQSRPPRCTAARQRGPRGQARE